MLIIALCVFGISLSVYLAYTCEDIKNKKGKIFLGIISALILVSSSATLLFTAGYTAADNSPITKDVVILYVLTALVIWGIRVKTKKLWKIRKAQSIIKLQEEL